MTLIEIAGKIFKTTKKVETIDCGGGSLDFATSQFQKQYGQQGRFAKQEDEWTTIKGRKGEFPTGVKAGEWMPFAGRETEVFVKKEEKYTLRYEHYNGQVYKAIFTKLQEI